jgi:hypothetical protein
MSAADYIVIVDEEIARRRRPDGTVDEAKVAEAIFARADIADMIAAFLERAASGAMTESEERRNNTMTDETTTAKILPLRAFPKRTMTPAATGGPMDGLDLDALMMRIIAEERTRYGYPASGRCNAEDWIYQLSRETFRKLEPELQAQLDAHLRQRATAVAAAAKRLCEAAPAKALLEWCTERIILHAMVQEEKVTDCIREELHAAGGYGRLDANRPAAQIAAHYRSPDGDYDRDGIRDRLKEIVGAFRRDLPDGRELDPEFPF